MHMQRSGEMGKGKKAKVKTKGGKAQNHGPVVDMQMQVKCLPIWPPIAEEAEAEAEDGAEDGDYEMYMAAHRVLNLKLERHALYRDMIFGVPNALGKDECERFIAWGEKLGFLEAKQQASAGFAHRDNGRIAIQDPEIAQRIFQRVKFFVPQEIDGKKAVGCSSNIRLYRYVTGQRFGKHIDESNFEEQSQAWSEFTLLFYLNGAPSGGKKEEEEEDDDEQQEPTTVQGGETIFYSGNTGSKEVCRVVPELGLALLHWHGDRCLIHEGAVVRKGTKYLLRTDVIYK